MPLILTETFKMVINPWVPVYLQRPINYSNETCTLPLTLQLKYKPLSILQRVIKKKIGAEHIPY